MIKKIKLIIICITILLVVLFIPNIVQASEDIVVLLDPGHGGYDSGAANWPLLEKDVTWKIATKVKEILDHTQGITGILSRGENECPEIYQRGNMAKSIGADLVVSFHINSSTSSFARGSEVYVTQNTRVDRFYKNSNTLAVNVLNNLADIGIPRNGKFSAKLRPTESGNLYPDGSYADYYGIIRYPMNYGIPSILIEHCFISNAMDREFINNDVQIQRIAQADAQAIIKNKDLFRFDKTRNAVKGAFDSIYYDNNTGSIKGKVLYNEVINDMSVDTMPVVNLISRDGTEKITGKVSKVSSYTYSYDINIMNLNPYNEYFLQVETKDKKSIPKNNSLILPVPDGRLGHIYGMEIDCKNTGITFNTPIYNAMLNSYPYTNLSINKDKIEGKIVAQEWLEGTKQIQPKANPYVFLVAEDGTKIQCEVGKIEPYVYGFSCSQQYIDKSKKYSIKVEVGTEKNVTLQRESLLQYNDMELGILGVYVVNIRNNQLLFGYDGYMTNAPYSAISLRENKIMGRLIVQEWLNGTKQIEPTTLPKLVIKDSSNRIVAETILQYNEPYVYSYEIDIASLEIGNYTFEVHGTNGNNISNHQKVEVKYNDQEIGNIANNILKIENGKLVKKEKNNKYDGYMNSYPFNQEILLNGNKITGSLVVQEWLNGTKQMEPTTLPKLVIKDISNKEVAQTTLKYIAPYIYSYEIDTALLTMNSYILEVQGTNNNNISNHQNIPIIYNDRQIGKIENYILKIQNGKFVKEEKSDKYDGYMNSYPYNQEIVLNGNKISGTLVVQEWLDGIKQIRPTTLPKLVIKDESNKEIAQTTLKYVAPYIYSYEIDIVSLGEGNYILEVQGTNPNNISTHQKVEIKYDDQEVGNIGDKRIRTENGRIIYQTIIKIEDKEDSLPKEQEILEQQTKTVKIEENDKHIEKEVKVEENLKEESPT